MPGWVLSRCGVFVVGTALLLLPVLCSSGEAIMSEGRSMQDRESEEKQTRSAIGRFNETFNHHDADALAALLTEDTLFEDTSPAPDRGQSRGGGILAWMVRAQRGC